MRSFHPLDSVNHRRRPGIRHFILIGCAVAALMPGRASALTQDDIGRLTEEARSSFQPVTDQQLSAARAELAARMKELEQFVRPTTTNGQRWMRYLKWDALKKQVNEAPANDLEALDNTLRQINANQNGLEHRRFRGVAKALQRYRDTLAVSRWKNPADIYGRQLDALKHDIETYRKEQSPASQMALSQRIHIIDSIGQAPKLVGALRDELVRPNAFIDISTSLLSAATGTVNRSERLNDCILGTRVHSDTHSTGIVTVTSVPSHDKAVLVVDSTGHVASRNMGYNRSAVIRSSSSTDYNVNKRVELSDREFAATPARAHASTNTHIHSIGKQGGGLGSRLVSRMGWKKARETKGQVEAVASDHARDRIENRMDEDLNKELSKARKRYEDDFRRPLERRGEFPEHIRFSSRKNAIALEATQASRSQLAAMAAPPETELHDMTMRLHESAVNNYSASILGGATYRQTTPDEDGKFDVEIPEWMKDVADNRKTEKTGETEPFKKYSLTFREGRPISAVFAEEKVKLTVHIAEMISGDNSFNDWDVTATYVPELSNGGVTLRREGELVMLPADFKGQLSSRQVAQRRNLEDALNKRSAQGRGFPLTIEFDAIESEGALADAGPLEYRTFFSAKGWLLINLDRQRNSTARQPLARTRSLR